MIKTELLDPQKLAYAATLLKEGKLVAFPTETVYGLGARVFDPEAVLSIFKAKGRPSDNPLIAHVSSVAQVEVLAEQLPNSFYVLAEQFFPGPLTVILRRRSCVPSVVSAGLDSVAVRMPSHPIASELIQLVGEPLVAPSANLSGKPSATHPSHVLEDLSGKIAAVINGGKTEVGIESTVVSLLGDLPMLLRPGAIAKEAIEEALGLFLESCAFPSHAAVLSPGMKYRHYAPQTHVRVFQDCNELHTYLEARDAATRSMLLSVQPFSAVFPLLDVFPLSAKEFYALLREADVQRYHEVLILCDDALRANVALMNRVVRAAGLQ